MISRCTRAKRQVERSMSMMELVALNCEPTFRTSEHFVHALSGTDGLESNIGFSAKNTRNEAIHLKCCMADGRRD